ncbi:MAG: ATP-dependent RNA helicase dbp4 [Candelina submexicana]|nr:MAG: ATP-dependent RNA helicase dbp4 [Candelina submexicana]
MAPNNAVRMKSSKQRHQTISLKRKRDVDEIASLNQAIADIELKGFMFEHFTDLPLSQLTASGLAASHFKTLSDIQARSIPLALKGTDCLGAAKTGSGKTLAFLVPVLENLYRKRWTELDGLGALIISPTRELAIQIFEVLRKIGRNHTFSAGLVIGGKSLSEERERLARMNILVCTPGRMLQHMDQTAAFEVDNLQMLVLDEADRIMDLGFQSTVDALVQHLPKERQTLLFSATQTKKVSDLARLSLRNPEYVAVHEAATSATPSTLQQYYIVTPLPEKIDTLWSFLRSNLKAKILVFLSSGKQVRFIYESFRHLQPGIPLLHLHGRQKQTARLDITTKFTTTKNSCLFATDVVARGLDFPAVDWVIQLDCPEDADTYIHRVGRTARYERNGQAVLFLDSSEEQGMLMRLAQKRVPIELISVRPKKQRSIRTQLQNMCFKDPELKYLGQKAFVSYVRSIHLQKDKEIFNVKELRLEEFSESLGLPGAPRIKFLKGDDAKRLKNAPRQEFYSAEEDQLDEDDADLEVHRGRAQKDLVRTKYDRMFERRNQDVLAPHYSNLIEGPDEADQMDAYDDFLEVKRRIEGAPARAEEVSDTFRQPAVRDPNTSLMANVGGEPLMIDSKRREKLLKSKKKLLKLKGKGTKLIYDDNGDAHSMYKLEDEEQFKQRGTAWDQRKRFLDEEKERIKATDPTDKLVAKDKKKQRRDKRKIREEADQQEVSFGAVLTPYDGDDDQPVEGGAETTAHKMDSERVANWSRKWFKEKADDGRMGPEQKRRTMQALEEPDTLEDLEALASGLLG